jgi:hypothetical protein
MVILFNFSLRANPLYSRGIGTEFLASRYSDIVKFYGKVFVISFRADTSLAKFPEQNLHEAAYYTYLNF